MPCKESQSRAGRNYTRLAWPLPTPENFAQAMAKLRPHQQGRLTSPHIMAHSGNQTANRVAQAVLKLRRNRARDPGGWSHELLIWLWHNPNNRDELVKWVHFIASPTLDAELGITLAHAQVVLLNKPGRTSVRPICWSTSGASSLARS